MFPPRYRFFRQHWTVYTYSMLVGNVPMYFLLRPLHEHQFSFVRNWKEALLPSDLPDKYTDDLMRIVDDELFTISSKQKYPMTKSKFQLLLVDKFQSQTFSSFDIKGSAFFTFSSRLALNDIKTIREYYPNLHDLFFKEIVGNPESGLQKLLKLFSSKVKINIETAQINDSDLQKVLLSENAKKFAISRELLFANSWRAGFPGIISTCIVAAGWLICRFGHQKLGGNYPAFFIAFILSILFHYFLLKWYFIYEMFSLDEAAAKIDNDHLNGGIEYFKSNIELGKFLHQILIISSSTNFTKEGNFLADPISFTERLENLNKLKKKLK